ncbi:MAG: FAD binding domain-containing protein [Lachnospiraceae bacterium]|nr:FAD binding domain-containing protein [Lachnospiraceae bacterium]MCI1657635.1 FAD binding domain-containing protein [Lachnospiraceae bacterium]MCI2196050.1 FAD binding domain-containing protein [Lachnospiraceae bacterium]
MIRIRNYQKPSSLEEAWHLNQKKSSRVIGGMLWTKMEQGNINTAIDLSGLCLDTIRETAEEFQIDCMVTLRQLEIHEGLNRYTGGAARQAVKDIVGVQFRNLATVGGSIYGRYGFSDVLTLFLAMDTYVELYKGGRVALRDYVDLPKDRDILIRLIVKKEKGRIVYQSVRRSRTDFPVLTCAAFRSTEGAWRFSVGARPQHAVLLEDAEGMLSEPLAEEAAEKFAAYAVEKIPTGSNMRGSAEYRSHLVNVLVSRAIRQLKGAETWN